MDFIWLAVGRQPSRIFNYCDVCAECDADAMKIVQSFYIR
jgi:hypothetical protein